MGLQDLKYHISYSELIKRGEELAKLGKHGTPIHRFGQIRNECWNCLNYCKEINPTGDKGYYACEYCGAMMHQ